jgi:microcystin-dependent protein
MATTTHGSTGSEDILHLENDSNIRITVSSAGKIGMYAATSPVDDIEVKIGRNGSDVSMKVWNTYDVSAGSNAVCSIVSGSLGVPRLVLGDSGGDRAAIVSETGDDLRFQTSSSLTDRMTIDSSGNVGIGTTSPGAKLDVRGTAVFNEDGADNDFRVEGDADANLLMVDASADRVGIGTAAPSEKLEVNGRIKDKTGFLAPVGAMFAYGGASAPAGWLLCDGSAVSRTTYADLFAIIGTTFGLGDGSTTFNLPDFRRRVSVGAGGSGTGTLGNAVGNAGGAETHTLSSGEMPSHSHNVTDPGHSHTVGDSYNSNASSGGISIMDNQLASFSSSNNTTGISIQNTGGGAAHNNIQPSLVVNQIIKY